LESLDSTKGKLHDIEITDGPIRNLRVNTSIPYYLSPSIVVKAVFYY